VRESTGPRFAEVLQSSGWVLAFDTSEDFGSVAVARVDTSGAMQGLVVRSIDERRQQASRLVPTIASTLMNAGVGVAELSAVIVGAGPGSFTGVRVAASTAKGLLFGSAIPLWAPSSLVGAAFNPAWGDRAQRAVAFDARSDRVYAAMYSVQPGAPCREVLPPAATTIQAFVEEVSAETDTISGSAARRHVALLREVGLTVADAPLGDPSAQGLIRALMFDPDQRAVENPSEFEPLYLRGSSAVPLARRV
jgi:tRNA threonylcarbamoyl adenosine modification protein YeaZ